MISCVELCRTFDDHGSTVTAVDHVSLRIEAGELVALSGASGSGKTTLLNLMAGLDVPTSGSVRVADEELSGLSEERRAAFRLANLGVVFQDNNLLAEFTAVENAMLPLQAQGVGSREARSQAYSALERLGVAELARRRPVQMSGGQRSRVGIARALAGGKSILFADEPTGALDSANSAALFEKFEELSADGVTVVVASHDPELAGYASRRIAMRDGALV